MNWSNLLQQSQQVQRGRTRETAWVLFETGPLGRRAGLNATRWPSLCWAMGRFPSFPPLAPPFFLLPFVQVKAGARGTHNLPEAGNGPQLAGTKPWLGSPAPHKLGKLKKKKNSQASPGASSEADKYSLPPL